MLDVKCENCGQMVDISEDICPNCGNKINTMPKKKKEGIMTRFKDFLARFKKVKTVEEWKMEARDAIANREFVIESLSELHRVEKAEKGGRSQEIQHNRNNQPQKQYQNSYQPQTQYQAPERPPFKDMESSLKELLEATRQRQLN